MGEGSAQSRASIAHLRSPHIHPAHRSVFVDWEMQGGGLFADDDDLILSRWVELQDELLSDPCGIYEQAEL